MTSKEIYDTQIRILELRKEILEIKNIKAETIRNQRYEKALDARDTERGLLVALEEIRIDIAIEIGKLDYTVDNYHTLQALHDLQLEFQKKDDKFLSEFVMIIARKNDTMIQDVQSQANETKDPEISQQISENASFIARHQKKKGPAKSD